MAYVAPDLARDLEINLASRLRGENNRLFNQCYKEALTGKRPEVIVTAFDFIVFFGHLSLSQCYKVYAALAKDIHAIIIESKDPNIFSNFLRYLPPAQRTEVYEALTIERLRCMIGTYAHLFAETLTYLSTEQRTEVYKEFATEHLVSMTGSSAYDFALVLKHLLPEQRTEVYKGFTTEQLVSMIGSSVDDFELVLKHLLPEQRTEVYKGFTTEQLVAMIGSSVDDFALVLKNLLPEQRTEVYKKFTTEQLVAMFGSSVDDFAKVFENLPPEQYTTDAYKALIKDILRTIIQSKDYKSFLEFLAYLPQNQCTNALIIDEQLLAMIVQSAKYFADVLKNLIPEQRAEVYKKLTKEQLLAMIEISAEAIISIKVGRSAADNFATVLENLPPEQRTEVYKELTKEQLLVMIESSADNFATVLKYLNSVQRTEVYNALKEDDQLFAMIGSSADKFATVLKYLNSVQRTEVYNASKKDIIHAIIEPGYANAHALPTFLEYLTQEQRTEVYNVFKKDQIFAVMGLSGRELATVFKSLLPEQRTEFYNALKKENKLFNKRIGLIKSADDCIDFISFLTTDESIELCKAAIKHGISAEEIIEVIIAVTDALLSHVGNLYQNIAAVRRAIESKPDVSAAEPATPAPAAVVSEVTPAAPKKLRLTRTLLIGTAISVVAAIAVPVSLFFLAPGVLLTFGNLVLSLTALHVTIVGAVLIGTCLGLAAMLVSVVVTNFIVNRSSSPLPYPAPSPASSAAISTSAIPVNTRAPASPVRFSVAPQSDATTTSASDASETLERTRASMKI